MGKLARKYVENIEGCKYIECGTLCGVCGKKLGFFYDDFWSINSKDRHLIDGVLCGKCHKHFKDLIQDKKWASEDVRKVRRLRFRKLKDFLYPNFLSARKTI